jgi:hypothetical protein
MADTETGQVQCEMPKYACHKEVRALEIREVSTLPNGDAVIMPADEGYPSFQVDKAYVDKHKPRVGGYYVVYDGGYESWSPKEAFESGYTLIPK